MRAFRSLQIVFSEGVGDGRSRIFSEGDTYAGKEDLFVCYELECLLRLFVLRGTECSNEGEKRV